MQTQAISNFDIDTQLMNDALQVSGLANQKETIEEGLKLLVQIYRQQEIRKFRGKLKWEGDLQAMREGHNVI
ncbi:MAG: type II toxin-antitoxin system VapB family antitoxin [Moraxellaceae bacterium]|nr:type II toxin-antitoxin system VapB family antitoxin [Moraxellaceae bacterium]